MRRLRELVQRFCGFFDKRGKQEQLDEEIESHRQVHLEDNTRLGATPGEARRQMLVKLGELESTKAAYPDQRSLPALKTLWKDVCDGLRELRKNLGFTTVVLITPVYHVPLTIGGNLDERKRRTFWNEHLEKLRALPGVVRVCPVTDPPLCQPSTHSEYQIDSQSQCFQHRVQFGAPLEPYSRHALTKLPFKARNYD